MSRPIVSVCGSSGHIEPAVYDTARLLGRLLAQEGISVLCGGRDGVMEAVCHGVSEAEGLLVASPLLYFLETIPKRPTTMRILFFHRAWDTQEMP